jgi:hypothetical protein
MTTMNDDERDAIDELRDDEPAARLEALANQLAALGPSDFTQFRDILDQMRGILTEECGPQIFDEARITLQ